MDDTPDIELYQEEAFQHVLSAARDLLPVLKDRAANAAERRDLPTETLADLKAAKLFSAFAPRHYGGLELPWPKLSELTKTLASACGSTSWIVTASTAHTILLSRFTQEAQDDIFARGPEIVVSMTLAGNGELPSVEGGYRLKGRWQFASGITHADWLIVGVRTEEKDPNGRPKFFWVVVEKSQIFIHDTWQAVGLRGTGSHDVEADDIFIPTHHAMLSDVCDQANPPGAALHAGDIYRVEYFPYFRGCLIGPILGVANGALASYVEQTQSRIGKVGGESVTEQVPVQVKLSESAAEIRAAELIGRHLVDTLADRACTGVLVLPGEDRVSQGRDLAFMARLGVRAIDRLAGMMGASGLSQNNPVQRFGNDIRAMASHGALQWEQSLSPYGKWVLGVPSGDPEIDRSKGDPESEDFFGRDIR